MRASCTIVASLPSDDKDPSKESVMNVSFVEFAGLTQEAAMLIEAFRQSPSETKSDILTRVLSHLHKTEPAEDQDELDLGQGAKLRVGEKVYLFLSKETKDAKKPVAVALVKGDGFYLWDKKIEPSKGSVLQPAMKLVQERVGHRNDSGELVSLSAWRQWHVAREGKLVPIVELKDPRLAHTRGRSVSFSTDANSEDLDF
jgi:hypothetical protein